MIHHAQRVIDSSGTRSATGLQVLAAWVALGLPLPPLQVRRATEQDAEGIAAVIDSVAGEGEWPGLAALAALGGSVRAGCVHVARLGRLVAGVLAGEPGADCAGGTAQIDPAGDPSILVVAAVRRRGIEQALADAARQDTTEEPPARSGSGPR
jgi:hypothetical protein